MSEPLDERARRLQYDGIDAFARLLASRSEGGSVFEADGVVGAVTPAVPDRSVVNSVAFRDAATLEAALDDLTAAYDEAGVRAWTVWTPRSQPEAARVLEGAGHVHDAEPAQMDLDLSNLPDPDLGDLDWDDRASPEELARVNDAAYGLPAGAFAGALGTAPPEPGLRIYRARVDGELASVLGTLDADGDCVMLFVATYEEHRGQGLSRRLMQAALADARDHGLQTSSLQATKLGFPLYERLGYRIRFRLDMYEKRS